MQQDTRRAQPAHDPPSATTVEEIADWFFADYVQKWVAIGGGEGRDPKEILAYWGVPMHAASIYENAWLTSDEAVLDLLEANQAPLRRAGYATTVVLDRKVTAYSTAAGSVDAIWSRRRADDTEILRLAVHFEVRRGDAGWRVISLASVRTGEDALDRVWRTEPGAHGGGAVHV